MELRDLLQQRLDGSLAAITSLRDQIDTVSDIASRVLTTLQSGGTIYTAGNGGSAAEAMHLTEELIGRYRGDRPPKRAICLNADPAAMTCIANDFGYENVFARQCEALLRKDDLLIILSTSGNSPNLVNALKAAAQADAQTIGLLGRDGGACASFCDLPLIIPATDSAHIQEAHQVVIHLICETIEA